MKRVALAVGFLLLGACAAEGSNESDVSEDAVVGQKIDYVFVPISNLETSRTRTAKIAAIKVARVGGAIMVNRCHQHYVNKPGGDRREIVACSNDKHEIIMDAAYGTDFKRWARVRFQNGAPEQFLTCEQTEEHEFSSEGFGGTTGHKCTPAARTTAEARELFAVVDAEPTIDEFPTRSVYLRTLWTKSPAETFAGNWAAPFAKAIPDGEYKGYGSSSSKPCKLKVKTEAGVTSIQVLSLNEDGTDGRVNAKTEVSAALATGAIKKDKLPQKVSSATRDAKVLIVNVETETTTNEYSSRNVRVVRFPNTAEGERANPDAGQTAVYVDDNYCQRLDPAIPAW